jgi:hypothetical protein
MRPAVQSPLRKHASAPRPLPGTPHQAPAPPSPQVTPGLQPPATTTRVRPLCSRGGGSCNGYDYVCGDPVNRFDLDGLCESAEKWCVIGILEGSESLPEGFVEWGTRRRGSAYAVIGNQSRRWLMHGACGGPQGDTGRTFNFRRACQTHDLGYDLMRYFRSSGTRGSTRRAVDALFGRDLVSHCRTRSRFDRPFCYTAADAIHTGVDIGSVGERYGVPK